MNWDDFYERFYDWAPSTRRNRISSLKEFGPAEEVTDLAILLDTEDAEKFIRKAIRYGVEFDTEDYMSLFFTVSDSFLFEIISDNIENVDIEQVADCFSEEEYVEKLIQIKMGMDDSVMSWDFYYNHFYDMSIEDKIDYFRRLESFGPDEEVIEVITSLEEDEVDKFVDLIHEKGVRLSKDAIIEILFYVSEEKREELGLDYLEYFNIEEIDEHFETFTDTGQLYKEKFEEVDQLTEKEIKILQNNDVDFDLYDKAPSHMISFEWDEFYEKFHGWDDQRIVERFITLKRLGSAIEVLEVAYSVVKNSDRDIIIGYALDKGIRFKKDDVLELIWQLTPSMNYKLLKEHLNIIPFDDLFEIMAEVENFRDLVLEKTSKIKNINLEAVIEYGDEELFYEVLKTIYLNSHNQSALNHYYEYIPPRLKHSLLSRLKRSSYVNKQLYSQLEFDLLPPRKQKKLLKKQSKKNSVGFLELIGLGALARFLTKDNKKDEKPDQTTWKWKYYDDLDYNQESGSYVEKKD